MKKLLYSGVFTLLLVGVAYAPSAHASTFTYPSQTATLFSQIEALLKQIQSLKGNKVSTTTSTTTSGTGTTTQTEIKNAFTKKDKYKSPNGFTIAPGLGHTDKIMLQTCLSNPAAAKGESCLKHMAKFKAYIIDPVDFNVEIVIVSKTKTTITFTYKGKDYTAVSPRDNNSHIFTAVAKALGVKRVNDIDAELRLDIQRKITEVKTGAVTRAITNSSVESAIKNAEKAIVLSENLLKKMGTSTNEARIREIEDIRELIDEAKDLVADAKVESGKKNYVDARKFADKAKKIANEAKDDIGEMDNESGEDDN